MVCPYCESEDWAREGIHAAEEWVSDEYVRHYLLCSCGKCSRYFYARVEYSFKSSSTLSEDQFKARLEDGLKDGISVWTTDGMKGVE